MPERLANAPPTGTSVGKARSTGRASSGPSSTILTGRARLPRGHWPPSRHLDNLPPRRGRPGIRTASSEYCVAGPICGPEPSAPWLARSVSRAAERTTQDVADHPHQFRVGNGLRAGTAESAGRKIVGEQRPRRDRRDVGLDYRRGQAAAYGPATTSPAWICADHIPPKFVAKTVGRRLPGGASGAVATTSTSGGNWAGSGLRMWGWPSRTVGSSPPSC